MSGSKAAASPGPSPSTESRLARTGFARATWRWFAASFAVVTALIVVAALDDSASAQAPVAPVLSCSGNMALDSASGTCLTVHTETTLRPSSCPAGSTKVSGNNGGHECQTRVTRTVNTGRTRQVYSHTTYTKVWVPTGTETVQTGTNRVWVPPKTVIEPLVPPVRVQVGTRTETTEVTRPGPDVLYEVTDEVEVTTEREVERCSYDPFAGRQCWTETVTDTHTETRTRLECCIPGPPITETVTTEVPVYEWQTTRTSTIPGYWREDPVYETRETGYWDRVPTIHYATEPVYETVTEWVTSPATQEPCGAGWQAVGSQCQRTFLGQPSAPAQQSCPAGSAPRYGDALGGVGPSVLTCQSTAPGSGIDTGTEQDDSGGPDESLDGSARPLHHLAGESDERLAELGIHRCADGLLSYVSCDKLPGRTWDSDPDICDDIEGTTYRPDHGGSCVTGSDLLSKCTTAGDCEETTIRTYCPAIGELTGTQIQEHAHPDRGSETYRVCIFDCSSFSTLPPYVRTRINGSYDYACRPVDDDAEDDESGDDAGDDEDDAEIEDDEEEDDEDDDDTQDDEEEDKEDDDTEDDDTEDDEEKIEDDDFDEDDDDDDDDGTDEIPPTGTTVPPYDECAMVPPTTAAADALGGLRWVSHVRSADSERSPQRHFPGGGHYLQVAPGQGWAEIRGAVDVSEHGCRWIATWVRVSWADQRPWVAAERRAMEAGASTRHLVMRWDALSADQRLLVRQWHRPGAVPAEVVCTVGDAAGASADAMCGWVLAYPAAYAWGASVCFELEGASVRSGSGLRSGSEPGGNDPCWVPLASGVDWIRSIGDYADGRVTVAQSGGRP